MSTILGKVYGDSEAIVRQGETGNCMYVIQSGQVEVIVQVEGKEFCLAELGPGDIFGEMALFENEVRSATVRAIGEVWVLTLPRRTFFKRVREDPSLAFRILRKLSQRVRDLDAKMIRIADTSDEAIAMAARAYGGTKE